jgi:hypothetical protein
MQLLMQDQALQTPRSIDMPTVAPDGYRKQKATFPVETALRQHIARAMEDSNTAQITDSRQFTEYLAYGTGHFF